MGAGNAITAWPCTAGDRMEDDCQSTVLVQGAAMHRAGMLLSHGKPCMRQPGEFASTTHSNTSTVRSIQWIPCDQPVVSAGCYHFRCADLTRGQAADLVDLAGHPCSLPATGSPACMACRASSTPGAPGAPPTMATWASPSAPLEEPSPLCPNGPSRWGLCWPCHD